MPVITSIKVQRRRNRVSIFVDYKYSFSLSYDSYVKLGLKIDQEISQNKIEKYKKTSDFQKNLEKIINFASIRPRSMFEIELWIKRKKIENHIGYELVSRLKKLNLINDSIFARWWVDQRNSFRPKPKRIIRLELKQKGIDNDTIEDVLSEVEINEEKIAQKILTKNLYRWKKIDEVMKLKKMTEYLVRKGFSWDIAGIASKKCLFDQEDSK